MPTDPQVPYQALSREQWQAVVQLASQTIAQDPQNAEAHQAMAMAQQALQQYETTSVNAESRGSGLSALPAELGAVAQGAWSGIKSIPSGAVDLMRAAMQEGPEGAAARKRVLAMPGEVLDRLTSVLAAADPAMGEDERLAALKGAGEVLGPAVIPEVPKAAKATGAALGIAGEAAGKVLKPVGEAIQAHPAMADAAIGVGAGALGHPYIATYALIHALRDYVRGSAKGGGANMADLLKKAQTEGAVSPADLGLNQAPGIPSAAALSKSLGGSPEAIQQIRDALARQAAQPHPTPPNLRPTGGAGYEVQGGPTPPPPSTPSMAEQQTGPGTLGVQGVRDLLGQAAPPEATGYRMHHRPGVPETPEAGKAQLAAKIANLPGRAAKAPTQLAEFTTGQLQALLRAADTDPAVSLSPTEYHTVYQELLRRSAVTP